ncbi:MAG: hypothetical protein EA402_14225 [Planctomycetota bacterium]|nr:MAG: hypothetical protein EA402_14225 [Planctomycetota bacterium]
MSLRINNNPASVNGIRNLQSNSMQVGRSMERLSSGLRINRAADDAAGLIISEQMRAQITGLSTAVANTESAVNMIQTAEGALDEMNTLLNKARSLALAAANEGVNDTPQLVANQAELSNIISSIDRIAQQTQFGTKRLLDGSLSVAQNVDTSKVLNVEAAQKLLTNPAFAPGRVQLTVESSSEVTASIEVNSTLISGVMVAGVSTSAAVDAISIGSFFSDDKLAIAKGTTLTLSIGTQAFVFTEGMTVGQIKETINNDANALYRFDRGTGSNAIFKANFGGNIGANANDIHFVFERTSVDEVGSILAIKVSEAAQAAAAGSRGFNTILTFAGTWEGSAPDGGAPVVSLGGGTNGTNVIFVSADGVSATGGSTFADTVGHGANRLNSGASMTIEVLDQKFTFSNGESVAQIINEVNRSQDEYTFRLDTTTGMYAIRNKMGDAGGEQDIKVSFTNSLGRTVAANWDSDANTATDAKGRDLEVQIAGLNIPGGTATLRSTGSDGSIVGNDSLGLTLTVDRLWASKGDEAFSTSFTMTRGALFQIGANEGQNTAIDIKALRTDLMARGADSTGAIRNLSELASKQALVNGFFDQALAVIDASIDEVTTTRGILGAFQSNTLETNLNSLKVTRENLIGAESTIRDVDFAVESANFTKLQIMVQSSTAMLAQANQLPQSVLQLLG